MSAVVADTHAILWYLSDAVQLSEAAGLVLDRAYEGGDGILVPTISLVEATYLVEKRRVGQVALDWLTEVLADGSIPVRPVPLTLEIAAFLKRIPRDAVPDLPDRVIAATAAALGLPLVTCDERIRALSMETIW